MIAMQSMHKLLFMGRAHHAPRAAQRDELEREYGALVERAASAIATGDVLVFLTGAGCSADSGLAIYKDPWTRTSPTPRKWGGGFREGWDFGGGCCIFR